MAFKHGDWPAYVPVAERRQMAERETAKLRKKGHPVSPVTITGRAIATTFWGKAWCDTLEGYHDFESRLPRGRTYVRNGSVVDLQIAPLEVTARVSGSTLYTVRIRVDAVPAPQWRSLCKDCAGGIDSLVELLQGRLSKGVMERLCRADTGLFPKSSEIAFSCSCPDHAVMCKHIAAVLYGVGARLDHQPELLFRLRAVDQADLVSALDTALPLAKTAPAAASVLADDDLSALFGLDMAADANDDVTGADDGAAASVEPMRPLPKPPATRVTGRRRATVVLDPGAAEPASPPLKRRATGPKDAAPAAANATPELTPDGFVKWWL